MDLETKKAFEKFLIQLSKVYNQEVSLDNTFNVEPRISQNLEKKLREQDPFLPFVNDVAVKEKAGEILHLVGAGTLMKRTNSDVKRRPTQPVGMGVRDYYCHDFEADSLIPWDLIDQWAHLPNFYEEMRNIALIVRASDRMKLAWHGQVLSKHTDPEKYPLLQDMQEGWIQKAITEAPEKVFGLKDKQSATQYSLKVHQIGGENADFKSLDSMVYELVHNMIEPQWRNNKDLTVLAGSNLLLHSNRSLFDTHDEPSERLARNIVLQQNKVANLPVITPSEFPENGLIITVLNKKKRSNLSYYFQKTASRRKLVNDDREKGVIDFYYGRQDFVIENYDAICVVHPDALVIKDVFGATVAGTKWNINDASSDTST